MVRGFVVKQILEYFCRMQKLSDCVKQNSYQKYSFSQVSGNMV